LGGVSKAGITSILTLIGDELAVMPIPAQLPVLVPSAAPARGVDLSALAAGQSVNARSLGQTQSGQTLVAIGRQVVTLDLAQKPPAGTALRLEVQGDGASRQFALIDGQSGELIALSASAKAALQALLSANAGKTIAGQVLGNNADGTTNVLLGLQRVDLQLAGQMQPGAMLRFAVGQHGASLRLLPQQAGAQPALLPLPVAVAPQSLPALRLMLSTSGQTVQAQVLANHPSGESEISVGGQRLVVTLPQTLPPGSPIALQVEMDGATPRLALLPAPTALERNPVPTALQALPAAVTEAALADQDTLAPALATLTRLIAKTDLPPNVAKAAQALLSMPLALDDAISGEELRQAIARSGVFPAAPHQAPGDIKAALLQLRSALLLWLGPDANPLPSKGRPLPPARGGQPRSLGLNLAQGDEAPNARDLARALLGEANSALHRLRLFQLSALPERDSTSAPLKGGQVLVEIPLRLGQELCMAQFAVGRDGRGQGEGNARQQRGWQMRFSVNFGATGEVGAQIGLLGQKVNVSLWAERPATAQALEDMLPEMVQALAAKGIEAVSVQCRQGIPKAHKPMPPGHYVDATG